MRKIKLLMLLLGVACMVTFTAPTYAAMSYTDETTFLTAIQSGYYLEDFSAYTYGSYNSLDPLSLSGNGYAWSMSSPGNSLYSSDSAMSTGAANMPINISFTGNSVTAVGGIFGPSETTGDFVAGNISLTLSDGTSLTKYVNIGDFLGFTSTVPITSMTIYAPDSVTFTQVDHFYVGTAGTVVPVPAAVWLLGSGLIGLIGLRRRFKK